MNYKKGDRVIYRGAFEERVGDEAQIIGNSPKFKKSFLLEFKDGWIHSCHPDNFTFLSRKYLVHTRK